jgi:hypothetical protein
MRIAASDLNLQATSASQRLEYTVEQRQELARPQRSPGAVRGDSVELSQAARELAATQTLEGQKAGADRSGEAVIAPPMLLAAQILARFFGRDITIFVMQDPSAEPSDSVESVAGGQGDAILRIQRTAIVAESETVRMRAEGSVQTSDGREFELGLSLELSRNWLEVSHFDLTSTEAALKDPLVLNLSGGSVTLGPERFEFDLSANGTKDRVATLEGGSAFLALDRNGNGGVDNGSELFGAISGDGFGDLVKLDDDGNGWIDEGDKAFGELRLWLDAGKAGSRLTSLAEVGVGAISLNHVNTPFSLKDSGNQLLGALRATGLFLYEDGRVGSAQQIDLAV